MGPIISKDDSKFFFGMKKTLELCLGYGTGSSQKSTIYMYVSLNSKGDLEAIQQTYSKVREMLLQIKIQYSFFFFFLLMKNKISKYL